MPGSVTAACCSCGPIPARRRRWCSTPTTGHSPCSRAPASAASHAAPCAHRRLCPLRQPQENHLMERTQLFDLMGELKLYGMKAAFDEIMTTAVKRQHEPQRIVGDLLNAEISEKHARSIKYQLSIAKLPLAKDLDTSGSRARRSTRRSPTTSPAADSSPSNGNAGCSGPE